MLNPRGCKNVGNHINQSFPLLWPLSLVKPSPSKKSRGGGQGGLRRAPTLGGPTPLSHATGQPSVDSRLVYLSHFKSTDSEADSGKNWDRTNKVIRTLRRCLVTILCTNAVWIIAMLSLESWCWNIHIDSLYSGAQIGRPDLVPRTPPLVENPADCQANLSTSSLGSTGIASTSPPLR